MKNIKYIISFVMITVLIISCKSDDPYFGEEVYNDLAVFPYVAIQDRNEDLTDFGGNNFWSFELTPESNGNQVRIEFSTQDENIVSHEIGVTFSNPVTLGCHLVIFASPPNRVHLRTIYNFPTDEIITKEDVAAALGVSVADLSGTTVYFGGRSVDADGNVVEEVNDFEDYLKCERHAYLYLWDIE